MSIFPLPVFEADADEHHRQVAADMDVYERLESPKTIVVRYGAMKMVGEFPYDGDAKPGCGSKLVVRTPRGVEIGEMLTTTCENAGCSKSVTRQEMLEYIEQSGGKDYPFTGKGKVLRVATIDDLNQQSALQARKPEWTKACRRLIGELQLEMKLVDVEPILGEDVLTFYFTSEDRIDFRELVRELASEFSTRIEMRQVGARDEARLVADYERCGQYCCCKNFLKVLRPVSMKSAKLQRTTLDPLKISGRCGRLMCCLRYEDATYAELKKTLPARKKRVGTTEGPGIVLDTKILVQLALVKLEHDGREIAVPVEELMDPEDAPTPEEVEARQRREAEEADPFRGLSTKEVEERTDDGKRKRRRRGRRRKSKQEQQDDFRETSKSRGDDSGEPEPGSGSGEDAADGGESGSKQKRRRRRGRGRSGAGETRGEPKGEAGGGGDGGQKKKRRRRRRKRKPGDGDNGGGSDRGGPPEA